MIETPMVVLDTNVLEAAFRSRRGASFAVLSLVGTGRFEIAVSVPLVLEYEEAPNWRGRTDGGKRTGSAGLSVFGRQATTDFFPMATDASRSE
jgi:hypothetical protein